MLRGQLHCKALSSFRVVISASRLSHSLSALRAKFTKIAFSPLLKPCFFSPLLVVLMAVTFSPFSLFFFHSSVGVSPLSDVLCPLLVSSNERFFSVSSARLLYFFFVFAPS